MKLESKVVEKSRAQRALSTSKNLAVKFGREVLYRLKIAPYMLAWFAGVLLSFSLMPAFTAYMAVHGMFTTIAVIFILTGLAQDANKRTRAKHDAKYA